jgi:hypothetical protein
MKTRDIIKPIARALPVVAVPRTLSRAAASGALGLGLFRRSRRQPPVFAIATGVVLAAAAAAALLYPSSRRSLRSLFQRTGGGVGKQVGRLLGEQVGAHPKKTADLVQKARELVSSGEPTSP